MKRSLLKYILICLVALIFATAIYPKWQKSLPSKLSPQEVAQQEVLYLPNGQALKILSIGYRNALANFFWFTTINYFGKHYRSDQSYRWLAHRCSLIQELDPHYLYVAEFCSLMLGFEAKDPLKAREVLRKASAAEPTDWRMYYLLGMNYLIFEKDNELAAKYFLLSSKQPNAEPFVARLAAKKNAELNQPHMALDFLAEMINNAENADQRNALEKHYQKTFREIRVNELEKARRTYADNFGKEIEKIQDLLTINVDPKAFSDSWGGRYFFNTTNKKIEFKVVK